MRIEERNSIKMRRKLYDQQKENKYWFIVVILKIFWYDSKSTTYLHELNQVQYKMLCAVRIPERQI